MSITSLLGGVITAAQLGLDIDVNGQCFLIPRFNNKTKLLEANFQIGYPGLIELIQRSGLVSNIQANVVFEKDEFAYEFGKNEFLKHIPTFEKDKGNIKCVYAYAKTVNAGFYFVVLSLEELKRLELFHHLKILMPG